ncbi:MAG: phospholipase D family protein [Reyranella sp.]|uniref:phospholipase D family protein n=1 Tax=Reyranella sp. TaxID=1929291 RepID=UPI003D107968
MDVILLICGIIVLFVALSFVAVYSHDRFLKRSRAKPSFALPVAPSDTVLDRAVGALMSRGVARNGLAMVADNFDAFAIRALTARDARRSLDVMSYIWRRDLTGRLLAHEIIAAADRGVRVRILIDDINTRGSDRVFLALDAHRNVELRLFNPGRMREGAIVRTLELMLRAFRATRRMHNKAWIADGRLAIVGGRNIGDEYFDAAKAANFHDLDLLLMGDVVGQSERIFDSFWNSAATLPIRALAMRRRRSLRRLRRQTARLVGSPSAAPFLEGVRERLSFEAMLGDGESIHWTDQATVVSDPPQKARGEGGIRWLTTTLYPLIRNARGSVQIISPYFVPSEDGRAALVELAARGVDVAILTNSLAATDVAVVHGAYAPCRLPLLQAGVKLFELQPRARRSGRSPLGSSGASLHTKAFSVDGRVGFVGSFNFDPRSAALNTEMGVVFEDPGLVAELMAVFLRDTGPQASYRLFAGEDRSLRWRGEVRGREVTFDREPEVGFYRLLLARLVGLLPVQSQL